MMQPGMQAWAFVPPALAAELAQVLTAQLEALAGLGQTPGAEVAHRQGADVVGEVRHARGADVLVHRHQVIVAQLAAVLLDCAHHLLAFQQVRHPVELGDDRLDLLHPHERAHPTARGETAGSAVRIADRDSREQTTVLTDGAAEREAHLLAVALVEAFGRLEVPEPHEFIRVVKADAPVLGEVDERPVLACAVQGEPRDVKLTERHPEGAARVRFLDAAGERAPAADADAVRIGEVGAGEGAGREDERVVARHRIDFRGAALEQGLDDEVAPGIDEVVTGPLPLLDPAGSEVDVQVPAHECLPPAGCARLVLVSPHRIAPAKGRRQ